MNGAWHEYDIWEEGDRVRVYESTNDNLDRGYPTEHAAWYCDFKDVESALKHTGRSRFGVSGIEVTVRLNGEKI